MAGRDFRRSSWTELSSETRPRLIRVMGLTVVVIGWLYLFGGRSGARQIVAASVVDRLLFVPAVLAPLAIAGVFPHLLGTFAILDPVLGIGAWVIAAYRSGQSR